MTKVITILEEIIKPCVNCNRYNCGCEEEIKIYNKSREAEELRGIFLSTTFCSICKRELPCLSAHRKEIPLKLGFFKRLKLFFTREKILQSYLVVKNIETEEKYKKKATITKLSEKVSELKCVFDLEEANFSINHVESYYHYINVISVRKIPQINKSKYTTLTVVIKIKVDNEEIMEMD